MDKIYGPYKRGQDGRWIIIVNGKTISYPKYVYEKHHGVKVEEPWTIDHKDYNPDNNDISNLQLCTRKRNAADGRPVGRTMMQFTCGTCNKVFKREARFKPRKAHWKSYCSLLCRDLSK